MQVGRYAHAKQFKRMKKTLGTLKTRVGRVHREVTRQLDHLTPSVHEKAQDLLERTSRILTQQTVSSPPTPVFSSRTRVAQQLIFEMPR